MGVVRADRRGTRPQAQSDAGTSQVGPWDRQRTAGASVVIAKLHFFACLRHLNFAAGIALSALAGCARATLYDMIHNNHRLGRWWKKPSDPKT